MQWLELIRKIRKPELVFGTQNLTAEDNIWIMTIVPPAGYGSGDKPLVSYDATVAGNNFQDAVGNIVITTTNVVASDKVAPTFIANAVTTTKIEVTSVMMKLWNKRDTNNFRYQWCWSGYI